MTPQSDDEKLETYLRQFRPRQPRALPTLRAPLWRRPIAAWAAVAALLVIAVLMFVPQRRRIQHTSRILQSQRNNIAAEASLADLNRVLRQDPEKLDSELDSLASRLLPDVRSKGGILKTLARE